MCNRHESFSAHHTETPVEAKYLRRRLDVSSLANWFIIALVTASEMLFPCQHQNDQRQSLTILAIPRSGLQCTGWSRATSHSPATNILRAKTPTFIEMMLWTLQHFAHRVPVWVHALDGYRKKVAYPASQPRSLSVPSMVAGSFPILCSKCATNMKVYSFDAWFECDGIVFQHLITLPWSDQTQFAVSLPVNSSQILDTKRHHESRFWPWF